MTTETANKEHSAVTYKHRPIIDLKTHKSGTNTLIYVGNTVQVKAKITEFPEKDKVTGELKPGKDGKLIFSVRDKDSSVRDGYKSTITVLLDPTKSSSLEILKTLSENKESGRKAVLSIKGTFKEDPIYGFTVEPYIEADEITIGID